MKMAYERVDVKKLKFDKRNARKHDKKNIKAIKDSLVKFGQQKNIVAMEDGTVIAGNGTLQAAIELGWDTIDVHWTALNKEEAIAYGLVDNRSAELAEWDDDNLKELLEELDSAGWDLEGLGWDAEDLSEILPKDADGNSLSEEDSAYTKKIKAPVYEPKGPKPELKELFDLSKTLDLIKKIESSDLPKNEKEFLKYAAQRHIVFNYQNIAEYYAHSEKSVQELFEDSALVIIDFNKAIENGFVSISKEVAEAYESDYGSK